MVRRREAPSRTMRPRLIRHCEERSDEAIQTAAAVTVWIASLALAMTTLRHARATFSVVLRVPGFAGNPPVRNLLAAFFGIADVLEWGLT